jgi:hypothetical protein
MTAPGAAWALFALFVVVAGATFVLDLGGGEGDEGLAVLLIGYATAGALVASRHPRNPVGWLLLGVALAFAVQSLGEVYVTSPSAPGRELVGWAASWAWFVWMGLVGIFLPLLFPDGRLPSRRWRPVAWLGGVALALSVTGSALHPGDLDLATRVENPFGARGAVADLAEAASAAGSALVAVAFVLTGVSLVLRLRRSRGVERLQLKWFAYTGLLALAGLALAMVDVLLAAGWAEPIGTVGWMTFLLTSVLGVPVATGIAILRHRLYDIDVVINRTLVYGALTATLAAAYLGSVLLLQLALSPLTQDSGLAIAASTLAVAALFGPARARIQAAVDRRFYRRRYDAQQTLERFSARLRDELDLEALGADLRAVVGETMQPAHVSLWLRSER